ncbi:uncharacterized protein LOC143544718 isoform X2 [Bidens hawaiensis]|uniref:uncharacterized protein LOC143544718 isoform X2 n=1 Tax=Bidens hawaiensis TaxID=980011 RepID=UPI00404A79E8
MGGGAIPTPATTTGNHHPQPLCSPIGSPIVYSNQPSFGPVPSQFEVQNAIFDLQRAINGFCEINEIGEIMEQCSYDSPTTVMKSLGQKRLVDAYHLLQTDPLVQRLVRSISSDPQVWDAILKNDAVQDFQRSLPLTEIEEECTDYKQESNSTSVIIKWIFAIMKSKIIEFIEKLEIFVFERVYSATKKTTSTMKDDDILEEKVRSSLLLSVVVLVIVLVTRSMEI